MKLKLKWVPGVTLSLAIVGGLSLAFIGGVSSYVLMKKLTENTFHEVIPYNPAIGGTEVGNAKIGTTKKNYNGTLVAYLGAPPFIEYEANYGPGHNSISWAYQSGYITDSELANGELVNSNNKRTGKFDYKYYLNYSLNFIILDGESYLYAEPVKDSSYIARFRLEKDLRPIYEEIEKFTDPEPMGAGFNTAASLFGDELFFVHSLDYDKFDFVSMLWK